VQRRHHLQKATPQSERALLTFALYRNHLPAFRVANRGMGPSRARILAVRFLANSIVHHEAIALSHLASV